ncbi:hypothetical protein GCM10027594_27680 [Hymenobacter agri]
MKGEAKSRLSGIVKQPEVRQKVQIYRTALAGHPQWAGGRGPRLFRVAGLPKRDWPVCGSGAYPAGAARSRVRREAAVASRLGWSSDRSIGKQALYFTQKKCPKSQ